MLRTEWDRRWNELQDNSVNVFGACDYTCLLVSKHLTHKYYSSVAYNTVCREFKNVMGEYSTCGGGFTLFTDQMDNCELNMTSSPTELRLSTLEHFYQHVVMNKLYIEWE